VKLCKTTRRLQTTKRGGTASAPFGASKVRNVIRGQGRDHHASKKATLAAKASANKGGGGEKGAVLGGIAVPGLWDNPAASPDKREAKLGPLKKKKRKEGWIEGKVGIKNLKK